MTDQAVLDALLRTNFAAFAQKVFHTLNPRARFYSNWHIDAMTHRLEQARVGVEKRLIINVPPRSLKSILVSVALPAFILGHHPGARLICVSYAQPLAAKLSRDFRRILDSDWYRRASLEQSSIKIPRRFSRQRSAALGSPPRLVRWSPVSAPYGLSSTIR